MNIRAIIKRSVALTCAYYLYDDWRARRRLAAGKLEAESGARHADLDIDASLAYVDRVYADYLAYGGVDHFTGSVAEIGPGVLWTAFLFAALLGMNRLFQAEHERGGLEGLMLCPVDRPSIGTPTPT